MSRPNTALLPRNVVSALIDLHAGNLGEPMQVKCVVFLANGDVFSHETTAKELPSWERELSGWLARSDEAWVRLAPRDALRAKGWSHPAAAAAIGCVKVSVANALRGLASYRGVLAKLNRLPRARANG